MKIIAKATFQTPCGTLTQVFSGSNELAAARQAIDWLYAQTRYVWLLESDGTAYSIVITRDGEETAHVRRYPWVISWMGMDYAHNIISVVEARMKGYVTIDPRHACGTRNIYGPQIDPSRSTEWEHGPVDSLPYF